VQEKILQGGSRTITEMGIGQHLTSITDQVINVI